MAGSRPKRTLYIDCTFTYQSGLNTGIQRVVRNIIQRADFLNEFEDISWTPVISVFGRYFEISPDEVLKKKRLTPSFGLRIKNIFELTKIMSLNTTRGNQSLFAVTNFLFCKVEWFLKRAFRALKYLRSCVTVFRVGPTPVKIQTHDHLILLDAFWTYNIEESIQNSCLGKPRVTAVIYDLIPLTHPQFVDDGTVALFTKAVPSLLRIADHFICISNAVKVEVMEYCKVNSNKNFKFDHFTLGSDFDVNKNSVTNEIRMEIKDIFEASEVWLTVGTIEPRKNHQFILDTFEKLWARNSKLRLLIIGRVGWKNDQILDRILNHQQLNKKLFFKSDISDSELKFCYGQSKGLIFASYTEGFGLPIVEAMASGLHVLCSDIPVFREVGKEWPVYFDLNDPESLRFALESNPGRFSSQKPELIGWDKSAKMFFSQLF